MESMQGLLKVKRCTQWSQLMTQPTDLVPPLVLDGGGGGLSIAHVTETGCPQVLIFIVKLKQMDWSAH